MLGVTPPSPDIVGIIPRPELVRDQLNALRAQRRVLSSLFNLALRVHGCDCLGKLPGKPTPTAEAAAPLAVRRASHGI